MISRGAWVRKELLTEQIKILVQFEFYDLPPVVSLISAGIVVIIVIVIVVFIVIVVIV